MNKPVAGVIRNKMHGHIFYMRLRALLFIFPFLLKVAPPSKEQCEEMLIALEGLVAKLGVDG